jgi:hypothetical protein
MTKQEREREEESAWEHRLSPLNSISSQLILIREDMERLSKREQDTIGETSADGLREIQADLLTVCTELSAIRSAVAPLRPVVVLSVLQAALLALILWRVW